MQITGYSVSLLDIPYFEVMWIKLDTGEPFRKGDVIRAGGSRMEYIVTKTSWVWLRKILRKLGFKVKPFRVKVKENGRSK